MQEEEVGKNKILNIKQEIVKLDENIDFLNEQKSNTILKIPETFINDNKFLIVLHQLGYIFPK